MRKGVGLGHIFVVGTVGCLAFLRKDNRHIIEMAQHGSDGNAARLDGENLVYLFATEPAFQLVGYLTQNVYIDLVVKEIVDFQNIAFFDDAVFNDFLFKKVHI